MGRTTEVPVTPAVLRWAIDESGYSPQQIAQSLRISPGVLEQWVSGNGKPSITQARRLAGKLHRPLSAFLLPSPPERRQLSVEFRHPSGDQRELNPNERRYLRRAARFQDLLSWLAAELEIEKPRTPSATIHDDPVLVAASAREILGVTPAHQRAWATPSAAFDEWRAALERTGHLVFLFSFGKESCRGFSLLDGLVPVVAVNTAWNEPARVFTLFHELGHLITRTSSACVESLRTGSRADPVERWCEQFAADVLMPRKDVEQMLRQAGWYPGRQVTNLTIPKRIANGYKVSLRAAVIRMIELDAANWHLYDEIPPVTDKKSLGGGGGGRNRTQIREDQLGDRATSLLVNAVKNEVLSRSQAVEFLDIPDAAFDELAQTAHPTT